MDTEFDNIAPALIHHRILASQPIDCDTFSQPFYFDPVRLVSILYIDQTRDHTITDSFLTPDILRNSNDCSSNIYNNNNTFTHTHYQNISIENRSKPRSIHIGSTLEGRFSCDNLSDSETWMHKVRLAQNCFEQNLFAISAPDSGGEEVAFLGSSTSNRIKIQLRSHRRIIPGEELCFWPSFELSLQLNIPFLAPANIISGSCFLCTKCGKFFSQPNPLKIHIKFACFDALQQSLLSTFNNRIELNNWNNGLAINGIWSSFNGSINQESIQQQSPSSIVRETDKLSMHLDKMTKKNFANESGKRLHHCTYCGKVYTRKYGLKIHIRTHTGLKPLSCRFCARSFSDPSNLNKHIRLHTQSKT